MPKKISVVLSAIVYCAIVFNNTQGEREREREREREKRRRERGGGGREIDTHTRIYLGHLNYAYRSLSPSHRISLCGVWCGVESGVNKIFEFFGVVDVLIGGVNKVFEFFGVDDYTHLVRRNNNNIQHHSNTQITPHTHHKIAHKMDQI